MLLLDRGIYNNLKSARQERSYLTPKSKINKTIPLSEEERLTLEYLRSKISDITDEERTILIGLNLRDIPSLNEITILEEAKLRLANLIEYIQGLEEELSEQEMEVIYLIPVLTQKGIDKYTKYSFRVSDVKDYLLTKIKSLGLDTNTVEYFQKEIAEISDILSASNVEIRLSLAELKVPKNPSKEQNRIFTGNHLNTIIYNFLIAPNLFNQERLTEVEWKTRIRVALDNEELDQYLIPRTDFNKITQRITQRINKLITPLNFYYNFLQNHPEVFAKASTDVTIEDIRLFTINYKPNPLKNQPKLDRDIERLKQNMSHINKTYKIFLEFDKMAGSSIPVETLFNIFAADLES